MRTIKLNELKMTVETKPLSVKSGKYVCVKDSEGYVKKILQQELTDEYTVITKKEWEDLSGETYYKETFTHGGAREGSGRKKLHRDISIRVTIGEKDLLDFIRQHSIDPVEAKKQLA